MDTSPKQISPEQREALLDTLKARFEKNMGRHTGLAWSEVLARLEKNAEKLWTLQEMERTGGEPDVVGRDAKTGEILFCDCSPESPAQRRSLCYDRAAWEGRKANRPENNVLDVAAAMGVALLTQAQYAQLQTLGEFDVKTSSWIETPAEVRKLGGALFCDKRYGRVFVYHNGAESYYSSRGFRGGVRV